jgi:iron complex outermembrane receptor protein
MRNFWCLALAAISLLQGLHAQDVSDVRRAQNKPRVSGIVRDAKSGSPLHSANVLLIRAGEANAGDVSNMSIPGRYGAATDRSGQFSFDAVEAGEYVLRVSYMGYRTHEEALRVSAGGARLRILMQPVPLPGPEIEISAMKAHERFSPVTFSDITREDIENEYFVQDIPVMLSDLPSVTFYSESGNGIGYNYLRMRGFDQRRIAVMVNGVPQNDPEDHNVYWIDLVDLLGNTEEIQVQRGAGSAFYGPPAIGGSINIVTGDFANRKGVTISAGAGSYNTQRYAIAAGSGLIDDIYTLYARLSHTSSDGYRDHSYTRAGSYYFAATRYDSAFTTRVNVYGGPLEDGLAYQGLPKFVMTNRDERRKNYNYWEAENGAYTWVSPRRKQEHEQFSQPHFELLNEWSASDRLTLNSALFYTIGQGYFDYDGTGWTDAAYYRLTPEFGFENAADPVNPIIRAWVDNRQVGWLPRVTHSHEDGTLTAGFELRHHRSEHWGRIEWAEQLPAGIDPGRHYYEYRGGKDIAAVYVQEQYRLSPRLNIMGNVQYVFNRYSIFDEKYVGTDFHTDYQFFNPRIGVNYNVNDAVNIYGNVSYTHREPRLKNLYDAAESSGGAIPQFETGPNGGYDFDRPLVKPEKLLNVELGAGFAGEGYRLLVNGYVMDFSDEIVKSGGLDRFGQPITGNAEQTLHMGLELSARWSPLRNFLIDVNGMLSRSRLERYIVYENDSLGNPVAVNLAGNRIAGFPEQLFNVKLSWRQDAFTAVLTWKYVGAQYTDNSQREDYMVDAYDVLNASLAYRTPPVLGLRSLDLRLSVSNIFDRLYAQSGEGDQFFVAAERNYFFDIVFGI